MDDDVIAGLLLTIIPFMLIVWYCIVIRAIWKSISKSGSFILIFSQSLADIFILLQFFMLGLELLAGHPFIPMEYEEWYSIFLIGCWMPMTAHYTLIAANRFSAMTLPKMYDVLWSSKKCIIASLICWFLGNAYNFGIRLVGIPTSAYAVHMESSYGFRPRNVTSLVTSVLPTTYLAIYITTAIIVVACYGAAVILIRSKMKSHRSQAERVESRLTVICLLNTVPFLALVIVSASQKIDTKWKQLAYSFGMVFNCSIQAILIPLFGSVVRQHLFTRSK
uniref:G-protein coupled receptors family 1 profile domain-containing protein n=1 Tax=Plectus sambesii TaxID=2011161 RepID=A0A914VI94_9BILA